MLPGCCLEVEQITSGTIATSHRKIRSNKYSGLNQTGTLPPAMYHNNNADVETGMSEVPPEKSVCCAFSGCVTLRWCR
jgi:hypothetical protein